jgi:hypothetical protein
MTKSLWTILMGMLLIFASCQSDDDFSSSDLSQTNQSRDFHFYGVKSVDNESQTRGVAQLDKLWHNGTTITVKLLNDPYNMADKIKAWAAEWEQYANITFEFVTSGNANVRIGFDWNESKWVTWSYTGTDCKYIKDQNEATVNFAFWDSANEQDKKADVLRAFGQVLGLEMEHRHLSFDAGWTSRIQQYWTGEIEDIPWAELKEYVFDPINERNLVQTEEYDENSIMIWPFDRKYATNTARDYNYELSGQDKEFIKQLYPGKEDFAYTFRVSAKTSGYLNHEFYPIFSIYSLEPGIFTAYYNNGEQETSQDNTTNIGFGAHLNFGQQYDIKVDGDTKLIESLDFGTLAIEYLDASACTELQRVFISRIGTYDEKLVSLDFSQNTKLEIITIGTSGANDLVELNLSKNTSLNDLTLKNCKNLRHLDLSACKNLGGIWLHGYYNNSSLDYEVVGFLEEQDLAIEFANNLPVVSEGGIAYYRGKNSKFNPEWIEDICELKGWKLSGYVAE